VIQLELQFDKKLIPCLRSVMRQAQTQEQTQEVRLTEEMPDIGRVISSWGQVLLRSKEWRSGGMNVSGGVMVWVLYAPEDGSTPQCVEAWLPFQVKWDFSSPEQDGTILAIPQLRSVDARSTSARKIMVRAGIGVLGEAMSPSETAIYEPVDLPEDVCVLKNTYPMCLPTEAGEKAFALEEILNLPETMAAPAKLLRYELRPEVTEQKLLADKLIFRGVVIAHVLYADADGQLRSWQTEVPFSQYAELNRDYPDEAKAKVYLAVTNLEMELDAGGGILLKVGLTGQYTIFDCQNIQLVEDAYSPVRQVNPNMQELKLPAVLDTVTETITAEQSTENPDDRVADLTFYPEYARTYREDGQLQTEISGIFQALSRDQEGQLHTQLRRWEENRSLPADADVKTEVVLTPTGKYGANGGAMSAQMRMNMQTVGEEGLSMVTGLTLGERQEPNPGRPSLILRKAGTDRLWDVAKRSGSTVEAIMQANGLNQEPDSNKVLLIPVI
jgi:hypothetical protein